ncbi:MAG: hypothetical protein WCG87_07965 [Bacteroidota bacterium]
MTSTIHKYKSDILLLFIYSILCAYILYCYPIAEFSWDGNYYVKHSISLAPGIRPIGYSLFLKILYKICSSLSFVVYAQFAIYFISVLTFLKALQKAFVFSNIHYCLLGILLLAEPAALYNCFNILSDLLSSCLTLCYISTLILYIIDPKKRYLTIHLALLICCMETRHIALFYPFFSILIFFILLKNKKLLLLSIIATLTVFYVDHSLNLHRNMKAFGVPIHTAFTGWTQANNIMFLLQKDHAQILPVTDPQLKDIHNFCMHYFDTATYADHEINTDWLWDPKSPLEILRKPVEDSLIKHHDQSDIYYHSFYIQAPLYARYATFIQSHYPLLFFKDYMLPNLSTLITPHDGEMMDYYSGPKPESSTLVRYHLKPEDIYCRHQIYKKFINAFNLRYYQFRCLLLLFCFLGIALVWKKLSLLARNFYTIAGLFIISYCLVMLYSSWFMPRYLLPILPFITTFIYLSALSVRGSSGTKKFIE